jgi:hypothetical protein
VAEVVVTRGIYAHPNLPQNNTHELLNNKSLDGEDVTVDIDVYQVRSRKSDTRVQVAADSCTSLDTTALNTRAQGDSLCQVLLDGTETNGSSVVNVRVVQGDY